MQPKSYQAAGTRVPALVCAIGLAAFAAVSRAQTLNLTYSFTGGSDAGVPLAGLAIDSVGNLYGTTSSGGAYGNGAVFKVDAGGEQVLYSFMGGADGGTPESSLLVDSHGNLYGTTCRRSKRLRHGVHRG